MQYTWFFFILIFLIIGIKGWALLRYKLERPRKVKDLSLLAHTDVISALPEYKKAEKRYYRLLGISIVLFIICIGSVTALAARPMSITEESENYETRDIMICADVSGSMSAVNVAAFDYLREVVKELKGQRIGISLFDSVPVLYSPLSNDYIAIDNTLKSITENYDEYVDNTNIPDAGLSNIGQSAIGCINNFDMLENGDRSRTIIMITDDQAGRDNITLIQAAEYGSRYGVVFYNIYPYHGDITSLTSQINEGNSTTANAYEMYQVSNFTGGNFYIVCGDEEQVKCQLEDDAVSKVVSDIMRQEAIRTEGAPRPVRKDDPQLAAIISLVSFCALASVIWRLKL